jgi:hypothetical protein
MAHIASSLAFETTLKGPGGAAIIVQRMAGTKAWMRLLGDMVRCWQLNTGHWRG